jgi:hypothetical protein
VGGSGRAVVLFPFTVGVSMRLGDIFKTWRVTAGAVIAELVGGLIVNGDLSATGSITQSSGRLVEPLTTVVYSAAPVINASLGNQFVMTITDAVALVVAAPTNPPASGAQEIKFTVRNGSGGAHGALTWNAVFKTQATAFSAVANGFSRTVIFRWDGTNWVELVRTAADVAN